MQKRIFKKVMLKIDLHFFISPIRLLPPRRTVDNKLQYMSKQED